MNNNQLKPGDEIVFIDAEQRQLRGTVKCINSAGIDIYWHYFDTTTPYTWDYILRAGEVIKLCKNSKQAMT